MFPFLVNLGPVSLFSCAVRLFPFKCSLKPFIWCSYVCDCAHTDVAHMVEHCAVFPKHWHSPFSVVGVHSVWNCNLWYICSGLLVVNLDPLWWRNAWYLLIPDYEWQQQVFLTNWIFENLLVVPLGLTVFGCEWIYCTLQLLALNVVVNRKPTPSSIQIIKFLDLKTLNSNRISVYGVVENQCVSMNVSKICSDTPWVGLLNTSLFLSLSKKTIQG